MTSLLSLLAATADIAVFSATGEQRVDLITPVGGDQTLVDPCWASSTALVTVNGGQPTRLQRREGTSGLEEFALRKADQRDQEGP